MKQPMNKEGMKQKSRERERERERSNVSWLVDFIESSS